MQYPFSPMPNVLSRLEATMSQARLARYVPSARGDKCLALRLYVWNARLCEEFYIPLQFAEVAVRNAVSAQLTSLYNTHWFDDPKFLSVIPTRHQDELTSKTASERQKRGRAFTPDHVVAGMTFGFWQNMFGVKLSHLLWRGGVRSAFPHAPVGTSRKDVYNRLEQLRLFRNMIMHHYAIFDKGPTAEYANIRKLVEWVCPDTLWLMSELANPARVIGRRPKL